MRSFGSVGNSSLIPMRQAVLSASHTDSNSSPLFNIRLASATGCSTASFTWLKRAPIPCLLTYVSAVNLVTTRPRLLKIRSSTGQMTTGTHMSRQSQHDLQLLVNEAVWSIEQNLEYSVDSSWQVLRSSSVVFSGTSGSHTRSTLAGSVSMSRSDNMTQLPDALLKQYPFTRFKLESCRSKLWEHL